MVISKKYLSQKGITLLEVLVAVAVTSIALVSFISLILISLDMEEYSRKLTAATMIADDRMKEIEREGFPKLGATEGLIDEDNPQGFAFKKVVSETPIENVHLVELEIFWENKKRSVSLSAYMAKK